MGGHPSKVPKKTNAEKPLSKTMNSESANTKGSVQGQANTEVHPVPLVHVNLCLSDPLKHEERHSVQGRESERGDTLTPHLDIPGSSRVLQ